jgi:hypothetical protein
MRLATAEKPTSGKHLKTVKYNKTEWRYNKIEQIF